ncbi:metallophosphoesterase [Myxococcota bacterium]|nr:metallophosphoesterase [Myxococcota bacterium]MBU1383029.1 metallophosphoesterase [Myxococcota bacterium]MBU1496447.1 metallophosphoesterase [Myxococcota bacterium]
MKLLLLSDLHLEFVDLSLSACRPDVVVLAGDISKGTDGIDWIVRQKFKCPVVYIAGNHEFYGHKYPGLILKMREKAQFEGISFLENESVEIGYVTFHGATLWTNFSLFGDPKISGTDCQLGMSDFHRIRREPSYSKIRAMDVSVIHEKTIRWLSHSLQNSNSKVNVVVTHHAPSIKSVESNFLKDPLTPGYVTNLEDFILEHKPDLWLHGHIHTSSDYNIGSCRVLCNPRGYIGEFNPNFREDFLIEI